MRYNVEISNNLIRETRDLYISSKILESQLQNIPYYGEHRTQDSNIENLELPPMGLIFYGFIFENQRVPTPEEFIDEYLNLDYFTKIDDEFIFFTHGISKKKISINGVKGRLYRSYPSFVRDFHFYLIATESKYFSYVYYSFTNDYKNKIDIQVVYNETTYNIGLCLDSWRSNYYKMKKQYRHEPIDVIYIELGKEYKKVGNYYLYTEEHLNKLLNIIKSSQTNNTTAK